jgi:formylglycine-generating enzyme required for sulfatase activity
LNESLANYHSKIRHPTPQGQYPKGRSVEGIDDLLGNALEWCGDWYAAYSGNPEENPAGGKTGDYKIERGGSWYFSPGVVRVSFRLWDEPAGRISVVGFRCAGELP